MRNKFRHCIAGWLAAGMMLIGTPSYAGMIGTEQALAASQRGGDLATVESFVAREDVRAQLEAFGVSPLWAAERVAQLSPEELRQLAGNIDSQPAGGDVIVILGIVFVVLLVLELLGVTNVFTRI
jgi:hypothetical protein